MSRFAFLCSLLAATALAAEPPKPATHQIKLDGHTFTLPVGFTIERVAGPPLVDRPIVASFDDRGRLYVADSSGSNEKVTEQVKNPTHRIIRLEDTKGTGVFDKATVFADKMMFPEGILWHRGSVYVGAPPHIWKLTDTDDNGKADKREVWFDGKTLTGCANDLHGPYLGPDGWIYWCKGAFAKQEYTLPNGKKFTTRASHIFRARPDGTGIEPVMTGGMDNPVAVAFLPDGERFFTTTFFQHPAAGHRDGLIHAVYGGIYGKDHDVIYDPDHKWTSPHLMPVMTHMGPAAPCGLHCYESDAFGKEYTSNLFACQFNLRKVSRHVLKPSGSTYTTEDFDFVVSDNQDFHPTDVIEDADGSLLVVDTGGWYKLCCPSSQLVKADVLGAIYRVRRAAKKYERKWLPSDAELKKINKAGELWLEYWTTNQPAVRDRIEGILTSGFIGPGNKFIQSFGQFARRVPETGRRFVGPGAKATEFPGGPRLSHLAVWRLCQIDADWAREQTRQGFLNLDDSVCHAAILAAGLWRDRAAVPFLLELLEGKTFREKSLPVRRAAVEALGRIGDDRAVAVLFRALDDKDNDRTLDHSITYALIELDNRFFLKESLTSTSPQIRRACLAALDQLGEKLDPKVVFEAMRSNDADLKETAQWIVGRHAEWADQAAEVFRDQLSASAKPADREALVAQLARLAKTPGIQTLLATTVADPKAVDVARVAALKAMAQSGLKAPPDSWYAALEEPLSTSTGKETVLAALATLRTLPAQKKPSDSLRPRLKALWTSAESPDLALSAMATVPGGLSDASPGEFEVVIGALHHDQPAAIRGLAADVLSKAKLRPNQLDALITQLPNFSPLDFDRVLGAFAQTKDEAIGLKLVAVLNDANVRPALRADGVMERIKHFGPTVQKEAEKLYAVLNADYEQQKAQLDEIAKTLKPGDVRRGQAVFNSSKTSCIACHTVGYVGGKQGPDLTRIGSIRNERDLLESILFPSASFVRSYEPLIVRTKDGKSYSGVPKKDAPDEIILVLAADKEVRIPRDDVEEVQPGKVSIMPAGLDKQLTRQELEDLIAFLKGCK
jgi:putative membrane-bound dehydrogenase-like protein